MFEDFFSLKKKEKDDYCNNTVISLKRYLQFKKPMAHEQKHVPPETIKHCSNVGICLKVTIKASEELLLVSFL